MKKLLILLVITLILSLFACSIPDDSITPPSNNEGGSNEIGDSSSENVESGDNSGENLNGNPDSNNNGNTDSSGGNSDSGNSENVGGSVDNDNGGSGSDNTEGGKDDDGADDGNGDSTDTSGDGSGSGSDDNGNSGSEDSGSTDLPTINVSKVYGLCDDFIMGVDISSLLSLEASGRVFYGFDGQKQDIFKTLSQSGVNYIRVRVWNDPFDADGNGYGGGNCTVDTAIALGKRAAEYGMGLLVDFHYSDFWADPSKQQAPKAWADMDLTQKTEAIYDYTAESIAKIKDNGIKIGMVQIGNETTGGMAGESYDNMFTLMKSASKAIRDIDSDILIAVHFTNPEKGRYSNHAAYLESYGVDYDVFATSYYPEWHGTISNLKSELSKVHSISGKQVMIAETSWAYTTPSNPSNSYAYSVQGQADEISACIKAMADLGDWAIGVFYWEPAWIDVPGTNETAKHKLREQYGAGWASSYAGAYDPDDAGQYYGATACIPTSLFDSEGYPLESLRTFLYVLTGTEGDGDAVILDNYISDSSFENGEKNWTITETNSDTVRYQSKADDAHSGSMALHFWNANAVEFTAEQKITKMPKGSYAFSLYVQGDGAGDDAVLLIYVISDGVRYEQKFTLNGWVNWQNPTISGIVCNSGYMTVGIKVSAAAGAWGTFDDVSLAVE